MKIVLVQCKYFNSWEALGLGYIGAYLARHMPDLQIDFYQGCFDDDNTIIESSKGADIIAFSCTTPTFSHAVKLSRILKQQNPSIRTVVGGYHASAVPEQCLVEGIDQVIAGEGEAALLNIITGDDKPIVHGRPMDFLELPWPDRKLIKNERNIQVAYRDNKKRITSFQSHRACPFLCRYCLDGFHKVLYQNARKAPMRYRPVEDLLDEIQSVTAEYSLDLIKFSDPTWNTDISWVVDFCRAKIRRQVEVPFYPNIHATICSEEMIHLMAEAGCYEIAVGIESGSPKILKQIGKGTTVKTIKRCVNWAKTAGILVRGYHIIGMPDETNEDLRLTETLCEELDLDEYGFSLLCPYPGTEMYSQSKFASVNWDKADEYSNDFWRNDHLSNEELKRWQRHLTDRFKHKLTWHNKMVGHGGA